MGIFHLADHRSEIKGHLGLEFAGELLHALVFHEAADPQALDTAVTRGEQAAFEQRRADTQALPPLLDAEGDLGLALVEPQLGSAAQHSVHEEAVNDHIAAARCCGIGSNYAVGDCATETVTTAFSVQPEQMVAIGVPFDAPELPDQAAFDKDLVHLRSPLCLLLRLRFPSKRIPSSKRRASGFPICALQPFNDAGRSFTSSTI